MPLHYLTLYWPHRRDAEQVKSVIAGFGSVQATFSEYRYPNWDVLGIDIPGSSPEYQTELK